MGAHRYETRLNWSGSTGLGWDAYDRAHSATAPPAEQEIRITTGESHGDPSILNPEQLLVMSASSCQMMSFLHLAAKARIDVVAYEDEATGVMPDDDQPLRITEITLRPRITVSGDASEERVRKPVHTAHEHCFIANSLRSDISIEPSVERR
jgi:organic hydroperoxide reductase OsmC/OhrA